jgi:hypothetical protein
LQMEGANHFRDRVRERDLDNFLVEELQASAAFRKWFLARLDACFTQPTGCDVRLHKSPPREDGRQTDVQIGWFDRWDALRGCVLIESKVTADFQPGQAEAYKAEADRHRSQHGARAACAVLVGPGQRLMSLQRRDHFDAAISLEEIIEVLERRRSDGTADEELDARLAVRIGLLEALCGKRNVAEWTPITIAEKRDFATAYADLAGEILPQLRVRPSTDGPKAITRFFEGIPVSTGFPCKVSLKHEFGQGVAVKYANLEFRGMAHRLEQLRARRDLFAGTGFSATDSGSKSLFVRVVTPGLLPLGDQFDTQREKIVTGLNAIGELSAWFVRHQATLKSLLS